MIKKNTDFRNSFVYIVNFCFVLLCLLSFVQAQDKSVEKHSFPLKLQLRIDEKPMDQDSNLSITGRLENISDEIVVIDKRNLWRFVSFKGYPEEKNVETNRPFSERIKIPRYMSASGDNLDDEEIQKEYLLAIKPGDYYEDTLKVSLKEIFFQISGKYSVISAYRQFKKGKLQGVSLLIGEIESNELEFNISNCKILR